MNHTMLRILLVACLTIAAQPQLSAAEYSALTRETAPKQGERSGKVYVSNNGVRTEQVINGDTLVQIINYKRGEIVLLNTGKRTYMRRPLDRAGPTGGQPAQPPGNYPADPCQGQHGVECKSLGTEMIHDRKAVKWTIMPQAGGAAASVTLWLDQKRHIPLKQEMPNGATMTRRMLGKEKINGRQAEKWEMSVKGADGSSSVSYQWYDAALGTNVREEQPGGYRRDLLEIKTGPVPATLFEIPEGFSEMTPGQGGEPGR